MTIIIGQLEFQGPYTEQAELRAEPGIYAVVCQQSDDFELIDLCESARVDQCLDADEYISNLLFYQETCSGKLSVIVHYTADLPVDERIRLKDELLDELNEQFLDEAC